MDFISCLTRLFALVLLFGVPAQAQSGQPQLRVFISADMEGVARVVAQSQLGPEGFDYSTARRLMTGEVNAAVAAAFQAGATAVTVTDGHGSGTNLLPNEIDRRASLITGFPMPGGMMQGLDKNFEAVVFIGYHARGSTGDGVLAHTYTDALKVVRLNGQEVGEYGLNAALAGYFGVPVVFVSGDRALVEQAKMYISGVEAVAVKQGFGRNVARTLHPEEARERIAEGVRAGLARRLQIAPVRLSQPVTLEVETAETTQADNMMLVPGMERINGRVVRYLAPDMAIAYRVSMLMDRLTD